MQAQTQLSQANPTHSEMNDSWASTGELSSALERNSQVLRAVTCEVEESAVATTLKSISDRRHAIAYWLGGDGYSVVRQFSASGDVQLSSFHRELTGVEANLGSEPTIEILDRLVDADSQLRSYLHRQMQLEGESDGSALRQVFLEFRSSENHLRSIRDLLSQTL